MAKEVSGQMNRLKHSLEALRVQEKRVPTQKSKRLRPSPERWKKLESD